MPFLNRCCLNSCSFGSVIPRWQNITKARPAGDTGGPHYTSAPYPRYDSAEWDSENGPPSCLESQPPGTCGSWLTGGDLNGLSAQQIQDTVNDIMTCATPDTAHVTSDHNCYFNDGASTVSMAKPKRFGGQWILAKKLWHGAAGYQDRNDPHWITGVSVDTTTGAWTYTYSDSGSTWPAPYQVKYRTMSIEATGFGQLINPPATGTPVTYYSYDATGADTIGQHTGIHHYSGSWTVSPASPDGAEPTAGDLLGLAGEYFGKASQDWNTWIGYFAAWHDPSIPAGAHYVNAGGGVYEEWAGTTPDYVRERISINISGSSATCYREFPSPPGSRDYFKETLTINNTSMVYTWYQYSEGDTRDETDNYEVSATLTDAYGAGDCYADWLNALAAWDANDANLASLRTDEQLANAPLIVYDEVGSSAPSPLIAPTMDDYSAAQNPDGSWPQRTLLDGADYVWKFPNGSYNMPSGFTGGATLLTPMRTGDIVARNQAGSDRHFWFNYAKMKRVSFDPGGGSIRWEWFNDSYGGFSDANLPPVSLRWMNNQEAQYDPASYTGESDFHPPANYPQAFYNQFNGHITGGKYLAATQKWPGVNFARPCGPDKYAVDQRTVCCVPGGDHTSGYVVQNTDGANQPLATGGLAAGNYIAVGGDGIYQITALTATSPDGDGNPQWLITVGSKLDDLPTGFVMNATGTDGAGYLGALRFPSAPGICGRAAVTTSWAAGILTINTSVAQPFLRTDPATGTIKVDLYDSAMTTGTMISNVSLTRMNDTHWTASLGSAPSITVAYMVGHGVDWTKNSSASRKTGVHLEWTFDQRAAQSGYPTPPPWYAGATGCTACNVTQFNYGGANCPVITGVVPFYNPAGLPVENPPTGSQLFDFPEAPVFDEAFGAHWQAAVMLTMEDPFYQPPFKPDCNNATVAIWSEDDGTGNLDDTDSTPQVWFYPHRPWVEAMSDIPAGDSLPAGVSLFYDPTANQIAPPYYVLRSGGLPIGDNNGNYASVETDWGFAGRACATIGSGGRFANIYSTFVTC